MNSRDSLHRKKICLNGLQSVLLLSILWGAGCGAGDSKKHRPALSDLTPIDLTHSFDKETIYWPTDESGFVLEEVFHGTTDGGYYYEANRFSSAEHGGTHLDAPIHFAENGLTAEALPLKNLIGPAIKIDVSGKTSANRDYLISVDDVKDWESRNGPVPDGSIILFATGYAAGWPNRAQYLGTDLTGPEAIPNLHFPGIAPELATWLTSDRSIRAVGIDTPSIDYGQSSDFRTHRILFEHNIPAFENVASMDALPESGFTVIALPMKIRNGSGGPLRIVALVP